MRNYHGGMRNRPHYYPLPEVIETLVKMLLPECTREDVVEALHARGTKTQARVQGAVENNDAEDLAEALDGILDPSDAAEVGETIRRSRKRRRAHPGGGDPVSSGDEGPDPASGDDIPGPADRDRAVRDGGGAARVAREPRPYAPRQPAEPIEPLPKGMLLAADVRKYRFSY